jgi:hypothetical protein
MFKGAAPGMSIPLGYGAAASSLDKFGAPVNLC